MKILLFYFLEIEIEMSTGQSTCKPPGRGELATEGGLLSPTAFEVPASLEHLPGLQASLHVPLLPCKDPESRG